MPDQARNDGYELTDFLKYGAVCIYGGDWLLDNLKRRIIQFFL